MPPLVDFILAFFRLSISGNLGDNYSAWTVILLWTLRIISLSLLFRTYVGPYVFRLVSSRLRVRSVSLRSVRGIYFRAGSRTWTVDRIGISFHRLFSSQFSRISIKVEGLKLELSDAECRSHLPPKAAHNRPPRARSTSSLLAHKLWSLIYSCLSTIYRTIEPTARPIIRANFVAALRVAIRALPALTHVVEFELCSARLTHLSIQGAELEVRRARINTEISLSQVETGLRTGTIASERKHHRRRFSVADLNARLSNSLRRAWDRAWGTTRFTACVKLGVEDVMGRAPASAFKENHDPHDGQSAPLCFVQLSLII